MPKVLLKDVVARIKDKVDKDNTDLKYYIGGEHFDSGEIQITKKGIIKESTIGPAFHMRFQPGDVLLMSRNPHLRKAGIVDFEGICSDVSYVCRTKDENVLMQRFIPFIFQTDHFWKFAEENKKGSTNFFLNWSDFEKYEFELPQIDEQKKLCEMMWAFEDTKSAYKDLLLQTDELVKSQFIEMFDGKGYSVVNASLFMTNMRNGLSPSKKGTYYEKVLTLSAITQGGFDPEAWKDGVFDDCPPEDKRIRAFEFYMCRGNGNRTLVGTAVYTEENYPDLVFPDTVIAAHIDTEKVLLPYLHIAWKMPAIREQIEENARTTNGTYKINQKVIAGIEIILPSIEKQKEFVTLVEQSDKSKFELKQAIEDINNLMRVFMAQNTDKED